MSEKGGEEEEDRWTTLSAEWICGGARHSKQIRDLIDEHRLRRSSISHPTLIQIRFVPSIVGLLHLLVLALLHRLCNF